MDFNEIEFDPQTMTLATDAEVSLMLWKLWKGEPMSKTTDEFNRLYDLRGDLLDKKYHDCQLAIIRDGYYVESDLPVTKEIADVTVKIHALEDEIRAQEQARPNTDEQDAQQAEIEQVKAWLEPRKSKSPLWVNIYGKEIVCVRGMKTRTYPKTARRVAAIKKTAVLRQGSGGFMVSREWALEVTR
jgi:hypothetical protein